MTNQQVNNQSPSGRNQPQPLPGDRVPTPEIGGKFHNEPPMAPQRQQQQQSPMSVDQGQTTVQSQGQQGQGMTDGEKYWYDQCIEARNLYDQVAPLAPYVDIISYLNVNPEATQLVMGHMRDGNPNPVNQNPELNNAINNVNTQPNRQIPNNNYQHQAPNTNDVAAKHLREQHMELMKQRGIPEHEVDKYVNFLMNPGQLNPNEMFSMYEDLRKTRGETPLPVGQQVPNQQGQFNNQPNQEQQPNMQQPPQVPQTGPVPEVAPMGIAGMNGVDQQSDPREKDHIAARAQVRHVLDPNQI